MPAVSPSWGVVYPHPSAPFDLHVPTVLPRASYPVSVVVVVVVVVVVEEEEEEEEYLPRALICSIEILLYFPFGKSKSLNGSISIGSDVA